MFTVNNLNELPCFAGGKGKSSFYFLQTFFEKNLNSFNSCFAFNMGKNYCFIAGAKVVAFFYSTSLLLFIFILFFAFTFTTLVLCCLHFKLFLTQ